MEDFNTNESTLCSVFQTYRYVIVATVSACSGVVSALCCIFVICLIFLFKKHYFFIQRMILYHCLAALSRALSVILRFHRLRYDFVTESSAQDVMCVISGFTSQLTLWILIMDYSIITFTLLVSGVFRKNVARLERLYVILIFVLPLTFNWIPFIGNSYGRAGAWCWIKSVNFDDCSEHRLGEIFSTVLWNVPFFTLLFAMVSTYLFTIVYVARQRFCNRRKKTKISYNPEMERLKEHLNKEVWPILFFPFGVILLNIPTFINALFSFTGTPPSYAVWIFHSMFAELQGAYTVLIYVIDRKTLRRLTYSNIKAAITRARRDTVHEYPTDDDGGTVSDSAEHSLEVGYRQYAMHEVNNGQQ